ncbi:MAG: zinc ribbon domain-containing protein [Phycisphaeraceae bacterium]
MPTYDYRCEACAHEFEHFQSMTASTLKKCPACGKLKLRRLIGTGAGIIFKGSGFYETDYRSDSYNKAAKAEKDGGSTSAGSKDADAATVGKSSKAASGDASGSGGGGEGGGEAKAVDAKSSGGASKSTAAANGKT